MPRSARSAAHRPDSSAVGASCHERANPEAGAPARLGVAPLLGGSKRGAARGAALWLLRFSSVPPDLLCRRCQSTQLSFTPVSGHGRLYSYAVYTRSFSEAFPAPYVLALVDLVDTPEVRLMTNVVETPLEDLFWTWT